MNRLTTAMLSACLMCAGSAVFAQDSMSKDAMSKDAMSKDAMSKDAMSKDAMSKDAMSKDAMSKDCLSRAGPIRDLIDELLRKTADAATDSSFPAGCLVTTGLLHTAPELRSLAKRVANMRTARARAIADRIQIAINAGELPKTVNARSMADFLSAISQGIMLQARDGASRAELHAIVDTAMKALPPIS